MFKMYKIINLGIENFEIDWGKNHTNRDYSNLFQEIDLSDDINYYYSSNNEPYYTITKKKGAKKSLKDIRDRLDLLGYSIQNIKQLYDNSVQKFKQYTNGEAELLTFKEFYELITNINIKNINSIKSTVDTIENGYDFGDYFEECILKDKEISNCIKKQGVKVNTNGYESIFFENIDPYITLRLLSENESNINLNVEWRNESTYIPLEDKYKIQFITEGDSDIAVLQKTLSSLYPHIADFFVFTDVDRADFPYKGTGNLQNFYTALSQININDNIIFVFDNDTAGNYSYNKIKDLKKTNKNLIPYCLPDFKDFKSFPTIGPSGKIKKMNINKLAVSIECFLDLSSSNPEQQPIIRWKEYNDKTNTYQGALENKNDYIKKFKKSNLLDGSYNCDKLKFLINNIIETFINRN